MLKKIPKNQKLILTYSEKEVPKYLITKSTTEKKYFLYSVNNSNYELLKQTALSPLKFKECYPNM